jgi:hypothetical protein
VKLSLFALTLLLTAGTAVSEEKPPTELERTEQLIEKLNELRGKASTLENEIDNVLKALIEQRGSLQNPKTYNALEHVQAEGDAPDAKKPAVRCAAVTAKGDRCTRAAVPGTRYCKQHELAKQK